VPFATNPLDQIRTFFQDSGGDGDPVLVYPGFTDPLEYAQTSPLCQALAGEYRLIFADHRGQGQSDKPHEPAAYALRTRVADAIAILNQLEIERTHYLGFSWGARLGFALGEHAPERLRSLVLCGNQPYEWPRDGPMLRGITHALAEGRSRGMEAFVDAWERAIGQRFPEPERSWVLANDLLALDAAFHSTFTEGVIAQDLSEWTTPCLIYAGSEDEMYANAARAASEIPGARFISLGGHTHFSAERVAEDLLPEVLKLFRSVR
jgi:pimeloyl-ACP methyl ester carboxylesterase